MSGEKRKRMSYTADFKMKVVKAAKETSNLEAARNFGVDESNVRRWRKDTTLEIAPKSKRANRGPKEGQHPEMEKEVYDWFEAQRQNGYGVSRLGIRLQAMKIAKSNPRKYEGFTASTGWCTRFMHRHTISLRQRTKMAQKLPSQYEDKLQEFQKFVIAQRKAGDFPLCRIGNMDDTPMCFDMPSTTTLNKKGEKTVLIKTTGHEKTHFTVVLGCTADGGKLPPMVIFKRKTPPKDNFPSGVIIHQHVKGWMDEEGVKKWLDKVWVRRNGGLLRKPSLLVWDQFKAHLTEKVKNKLREERTIQAVIPGGLTGMLQPLDVSLNKPFKVKMRCLWTQRMAEVKVELTAKGNYKRPPLHTVVSWVKTDWEEIPPEMVKKSFLKCSISNNLDGSEDDFIWQDTHEESEDDGETVEADEEMWDDENAQYTEEDWIRLFGESDNDGGDNNELEGF